jgi:hypothetical protein
LIYAEYVLENWPTKERYRELKNQAGKGLCANFQSRVSGSRRFGDKTFTPHLFHPRRIVI